MPNTHDTLTSLFSDIAQAIRDKKGETSEVKYVADEFPDAIADIQTGGGYSTLTAITGTTGSQSTGSSGVLNVSFTDSLVAGAKLYCIIFADIYTTNSPALSYIVFKADGTVVGRNVTSISVSIGSDSFTVSISRSAGTGQTYRYTFRGFALS